MIFGEPCLKLLEHMPPVCRTNPPLYQKAAGLIDQASPILHKRLARPVEGLQVEFALRLDWHETHCRTGRGFCDALGVLIIILVYLYVRSNVMRRHQAWFVTELQTKTG